MDSANGPAQANMPSEPSFLGIPRELRDQIYVHYVTTRDGYVYNFHSNKLALANPEHPGINIDLALKLTCKQIATEMGGLALRYNTVTFSTVYSDELRSRAARFHYLRSSLSLELASFLYYDGNSPNTPKPYFTQPVVDQVVRSYPFMKPLLQKFLDDEENGPWDIAPYMWLRARRPPCDSEDAGTFSEIKAYLRLNRTWGVVPSLFRQAIKHTLQVAVDHGCFATPAVPAARRPTYSPSRLLALDAMFPSWSIPGEDELVNLAHPFAPGSNYDGYCMCDNSWCAFRREFLEAGFWEAPQFRYNDGQPDDPGTGREGNQGKYRFSAAAAAVKFLSSCPVRMHLRSIRLLEDKLAVAYPESHAQGLIKFCIENPRLHVERRVDLWRNVFQSGDDEVPWLPEGKC